MGACRVAGRLRRWVRGAGRLLPWLQIVAGAAVTAVAVNVFLVPFKLADGGISTHPITPAPGHAAQPVVPPNGL